MNKKYTKMNQSDSLGTRENSLLCKVLTVYVVIFAVVLFSRVSSRKKFHFNIWLFKVMKKIF